MTGWRPKLLIALLSLFVVALVAAGCGDEVDETTTGAAAGEELDTLEPGVLTVGSDIPFAPFEFGDPPDYEGFDIDIVNAIAEKLGVETKIVKTPFDTIFRDLAAGNKFDIVASSTTITPERDKQVDFSDPYFIADQSILVQEGSDIESVEDLAGQTVGVQIGTTGADYAEEETDAGEVRTFDLADDAVQALQSGQIAAVLIDFPLAEYAAQQEKGVIRVADIVGTDENYGIALQTDSPLTEPINSALQELKDDGTYARIYQEWFDEEPPPEILGSEGAQTDAETTETEDGATENGEDETTTDGGAEGE